MAELFLQREMIPGTIVYHGQVVFLNKFFVSLTWGHGQGEWFALPSLPRVCVCMCVCVKGGRYTIGIVLLTRNWAIPGFPYSGFTSQYNTNTVEKMVVEEEEEEEEQEEEKEKEK